MNRKLFLFLAIFTAALLPVTATAALVINDPIIVATSQNNAVVYVANGPEYQQAHTYGFITTDYAQSGQNATVYLYYAHHANVTLTNVLELVNGATANADVYLNGTLPGFIAWYYSSSLIPSSSSSYGTQIASGSPIPVAHGSQVYITVVMDTLNVPGSTTSVSITLQYALS